MIKLVNIEMNGIKYENYILIENIHDLNEYYEEFRKPQVYRAFDGVRNPREETRLSNFMISDSKVKYGTEAMAIGNFIRLLGNVYTDQLRNLLDGNLLVLNYIGGYFPIRKKDQYKIEPVIPKAHKILKPKFF